MTGRPSKLYLVALLVAIAFLPFVATADNPIAYRIGPGAQFSCSAAVPSHISTRGTMWCNSSDNNKLYYTDPLGTSTALGQTQPFQLMTATFTASDSASLSWSNIGGTQYVFAGVPIVTDGGGGVVLHVINKTTTGATLKASAPFTGTVAVTVVSN